MPALAHPPGGAVEIARSAPKLVEAEPLLPPVARAVPRTETVHGEVRVDEYFWLRNRGDPEVIAYMYAGIGNFIGMRWADWTVGGHVPEDVLGDVLTVLARGLPPAGPARGVSPG